MRPIFTCLFFIFVSLFAIANDLGGDGVGNGGDGLTQIFVTARARAINLIRGINRCSFQVGTSPTIKEWVINNKAKLLDDLHQTTYVWVEKSPRVKCAWTLPIPNATIEFSIQDCRIGRIYNTDSAAALILHETIHHLGYDDSAGFPDRVSEAVMLANLPSTYCPVIDPFSPDSCPSPSPSPSPSPPFSFSKRSEVKNTKAYSPLINPPQSSLRLAGEYRLSSRTRHCTMISGCNEWVLSAQNDISSHAFLLASGDYVLVPNTGSVFFSIEQPSYSIYLQTIGWRKCWLSPFSSDCIPGFGPGSENDLYVENNGIRQKLQFQTVFLPNNCLRQYSKLVFRENNSNAWVEEENVVFYPSY
ncbi:MAG: hypothetical protein SGJ18_01020 [Pseudomonadota bacterium]|nr:hypothetical protein [Pseudomonadota bacterium]